MKIKQHMHNDRGGKHSLLSLSFARCSVGTRSNGQAICLFGGISQSEKTAIVSALNSSHRLSSIKSTALYSKHVECIIEKIKITCNEIVLKRIYSTRKHQGARKGEKDGRII